MTCAPDDCRCDHDHDGHEHDASQQDHSHGAGCCGGTAVHDDTGNPQVAENA